MPNQTNTTIAQIRTELLTTFRAADWVSYNHLVGWLRDTDVASHALKVGDADGRLHSSPYRQGELNGRARAGIARGPYPSSVSFDN